MRKYFYSLIILNLILFSFHGKSFSSVDYPVAPKQINKSKSVSNESTKKSKLSEETKGLHGKPQDLKGTLNLKPSSKAAKTAVEEETPEQENMFSKSLTALYRKDFVEAEQQLRELVENQKDSAKYHYYLGYTLYSQKRMAEAIKEFQISYALDPEFSRSLPAK